MSNNGPSNIRINPFVGSGGATTYVNLTETHIIPSASPFVIRLNEVPEKRDPSNMKCVYVDNTTGAVTSRALTEVAATPAAGQFRPDYSTKADKDDSWNTGLVEFNSADAGKIVQITYTGMGTLAAVQSNKYPSWYTDRGDGSDGDFIPSENTTISGVKNYKRVFIKEGVTVTVDSYCLIKCLGEFVNNGTITAESKGALGGEGGKLESSAFTSAGSGSAGNGGGYGGAGGNGRSTSGGAGGVGLDIGLNINFDTNTLKSFLMQGNLYGLGAGGGGGGGVGGQGGRGGGGIFIVSNTAENQGKISSNGEDGFPAKFGGGGGGGGGGGAIVIVATTINNNGTVVANGGSGGNPNGANGDTGNIIIKQLGVL